MVAACPFPAPRGTPLRIYRLAEALAARGHNVHVVTYHLGTPAEPVPFKIHRIHDIPTYRRLAPGPNLQKLALVDPMLTLKLLSLVRKERIDLIHAHHYEGFLVSLPARRLAGVPIIFDVHTLLEPELPHYRLGMPTRIKRRIASCLDSRLPRKADHILAVTEDIRDQLVEKYGVPDERVTVATNGVLLSLFDDLETKSKATSDNLCKLIYTGNTASYQGIDLMLQAYRQVLDQKHDVVMRIVTEGDLGRWDEYADSIGVGDHVEFHQVGFRDAVELLADSDIAINPRVDCPGIPQKLVNYMAAGKAIVSFAGSAKHIVDGETGLVVEDGNVDAMASAILRLANDRELAQRLGDNADRLARNELSWDVSASIAEDVYHQLLGAGR